MSTTPVPDAMILASIERAALHRGRLGVPIWMILEHLGLPRRARRVRPPVMPLLRLTRSTFHGFGAARTGQIVTNQRRNP